MDSDYEDFQGKSGAGAMLDSEKDPGDFSFAGQKSQKFYLSLIVSKFRGTFVSM